MLRALARAVVVPAVLLSAAILFAAILSGAVSLPALAQGEAPLTVSAVEVVAERDTPQVCVTLSDRLDREAGGDFRAFVGVAPPVPVNVVVRDRTLCVEGVQHGQTYTLTLKEGLPGQEGRRLAATDTRTVEVPNRRPSLAFRGSGFILPRSGAAGLTLRSVNVDRVRLQVLRIADRGLVERVYFGRIAQRLSERELSDLIDRSAQEVWKDEMAVSGNRNQPAVTAVPIDAVLGRLEPGVYIAVAASDTLPGEPWERRATQWFLVSDLGLNTILAEDSLLVYARSLASAAPMAGVELRLVARGTAELGRVTTGPDGIARFDAALLRGSGDAAPQAIFASHEPGDVGFLDLAAPAFELVDRATVAPAAPALDAYLQTPRGVYRPGESLEVTALLRDAGGRPVPSRPLSFALIRPDGLEADRQEVADAGGGGYVAGFSLPAGGMTGAWTVTAHAEPGGPAVGRTSVRVEDFGPPRLAMTLAGDRPALDATGEAAVTVSGRFLDGSPAAELPGEAALTLRPAAAPYPQHAGYRFGLAQEEMEPQRTALPGFTTDEEGRARIPLRLERAPDSSHPLEAVLEASLVDFGGRPVRRELVLPVRHRPFAIGIKPRFADNAVPEGATAGFDVIAVAPDGTPIDRPGLSYEIFEEEHEYSWFETDGRWDYKAQVRDRRVAGGTLSPGADKPALVEEAVQAGRYRLEVFDPATGVASGVRFAAGWWLSPTSDERPDEVDVTVMLPSYRGGQTATVYIQPPYASQVLIAVADRRIRYATTRAIGREGAFLEIPVDAAWAGGVHVIASAFPVPDAAGAEATPGAQRKAPPARRALGRAWLGVAPGERRLEVRIEAPVAAEAHTRVTPVVTVTGVEPGQPAFVAVTAVDDSVLALTGHRDPDGIGHYFSPRDLAVELRDVYGRLVEPASAAAAVRPQAAPLSAVLPGQPVRSATFPVKIVPVGEDGRVEVPLPVLPYGGRFRLTALAWSGDRMGSAGTGVTVAEPLRIEPVLPHSLAVGDRAEASVVVEARAGGDPYRVTLAPSRALRRPDGETPAVSVAAGQRLEIPVTLQAESLGDGELKVSAVTADGRTAGRAAIVAVRSADRPVQRRQSATVAAGAAATLGAELPAGIRPDGLRAGLALGGVADLDLPGLILNRPRGGGTLLTAGQLAGLLGTPDEAAELMPRGVDGLRAAQRAALQRLLTFQRPDGAFAAWSPTGEADLWLSAHALDLLVRARAAGLRVPDAPFRAVVEALRRPLQNPWAEPEELPVRAYVLYALARAKAIDAAPLRFFRETLWDKAPTELARAQVAAALAALGDGRAATEILDRLTGVRTAAAPPVDHGSPLRDEAAVLLLMAETGVDRERVAAAAERLARTAGGVATPSVQERGWLLLAGRALMERGAAVKAVVGERPVEAARLAILPVDPATLPLTVRNGGGDPLRATLAVSGAPAEPAAAAEQQGFTISRRLFDMDGNPVDPATARRNARLVVVLEGRATDEQRHEALVTDMLPAGFVLEAVRNADSPPLGGLAWIGRPSVATHTDTAPDRFTAAVTLTGEQPSFRLVYMARAAFAGDFFAPGPVVEDIDRPTLFARGEAGRVRVTAE